jgi:hypothetical protein
MKIRNFNNKNDLNLINGIFDLKNLNEKQRNANKV